MEIPVATYAIIGVTFLVSIVGFGNAGFVERFIFAPEHILRSKEGYRLVTSAFLHGDWGHLIFNMISLFSFGASIERGQGVASFLFIYFMAIIGGGLLSLFLHRNHVYRALGASGGVCGIIFSHIFLFPNSSILFFFIPIPIPSWLYAIVFLLISFYGMKSGRDNIGHDAHLGGAIIGLLTATALYPDIVKRSPSLYAAVMIISLALFVYLLKNPLFLPLESFSSSRPDSPKSARKPPSNEPDDDTMNAILDKISRHGMESLTEAEHKALEDASRKIRRNPGDR